MKNIPHIFLSVSRITAVIDKETVLFLMLRFLYVLRGDSEMSSVANRLTHHKVVLFPGLFQAMYCIYLLWKDWVYSSKSGELGGHFLLFLSSLGVKKERTETEMLMWALLI